MHKLRGEGETWVGVVQSASYLALELRDAVVEVHHSVLEILAEPAYIHVV